ncbi:hypothetical protein FNV43_RR17237 [Rhamnella rubrinervis]|uniref:Fungal lipase-type domain-containing protein n=1 Tax=Rhamnella rubrinervis TaxID=2594499 RepID=A0A8K0DWQ5_9ROSA|nr:hypothetical protein FNV43_RR17237 [Rhamnella rubrinervis]
MVSATEFSTNFVVLREEKASFCDLLCFLLFGYTGGEEEEAFIEFATDKMEQNLMRRQVLKPDRESATFRTIVGYMDKRVKLDKKFKPGDDKYCKALSAMAAKIAYENKAFIKTTVTKHWEMELIDFYKFWNVFEKKYTTTAYIVMDKKVDPEMIVVAFRGTEFFNADLRAADVDISWYEYPGMGKVHGSFLKALGLQENGWPREVDHDDHHPLAYYTIRNQLKDLVCQNNKTKFIITGHCTGGALAILFPAVLALHGEVLLLERLEGVYTFGQPRIGDDVFGQFMEQKLQLHEINYQRIVYSNDLVPRENDPAFTLKHFGTCLYYNCFYKGKILEEDDQPKEISKFAILFKFAIAVRELMRGFVIPYIKGPEYRESLVLKAFRLIGLILPGYASHNVHDYVNVTRLGSI